jgi:heterotetrameric sarcosine oxidase gamma subunit
VAKLIAKSALGEQAAITCAATTLAQMDVGPITSVAPFPNREAAVAKALGGFPAPNRFVTAGAAQIVWSGRAQAFYIGAPCPDLGDLAAVTDQTGGWVTLSLTGAAVADVLARYVPIDLRAMPVGGAVRSQLYHMPLLLTRQDAQVFYIMTFRSMARTAWHELELAMKTLAARAI